MYQNRNSEMDVLSLYLGNYKKRLYLREISRLATLPLKTTQSTLSKLENEHILKGNYEGKNKYFVLNLENIRTKLYLLNAEIYRTNLFISKYTLFKPFLKELKTNATLIIFGSFAKFKADKNSDTDLMIISKEKIELPKHVLAFKLHEVNISELNFIESLRTGETITREIMDNHVILNNHSFYVNTIWNYYLNNNFV